MFALSDLLQMIDTKIQCFFIRKIIDHAAGEIKFNDGKWAQVHLSATEPKGIPSCLHPRPAPVTITEQATSCKCKSVPPGNELFNNTKNHIGIISVMHHSGRHGKISWDLSLLHISQCSKPNTRSNEYVYKNIAQESICSENF